MVAGVQVRRRRDSIQTHILSLNQVYQLLMLQRHLSLKSILPHSHIIELYCDLAQLFLNRIIQLLQRYVLRAQLTQRLLKSFVLHHVFDRPFVNRPHSRSRCSHRRGHFFHAV